ncbi:MAG: hypothetical protein WKF73_03650 [Nocardioidaceae bacterium]
MAPEGTALLVVALPTSPSYRIEEERENVMAKVIIGVDPHKLSATIEVVDAPREAARRRGGSPPTGPATPRCGPT